MSKPDLSGWTADQHKRAGDEALAVAIGQPNRSDAVNWSTIAAAHYAAAELLVGRWVAAGAGAEEATYSPW